MNAHYANSIFLSFTVESIARCRSRGPLWPALAIIAALCVAVPRLSNASASDRTLTIGAAHGASHSTVDERILKPFEVMRRVGIVNLVAADVHSSISGETSLESISFEWFPGESATFDFTRYERSLADSVSWNGQLRSEDSEGYLTLTASNQSVSGVLGRL